MQVIQENTIIGMGTICFRQENGQEVAFFFFCADLVFNLKFDVWMVPALSYKNMGYKEYLGAEMTNWGRYYGSRIITSLGILVSLIQKFMHTGLVVHKACIVQTL